MVVTKSKSHPNLLWYGRRGPLTDKDDNDCGDSVSSEEFSNAHSHEKSSSSSNCKGRAKEDLDLSVIGSLLWKLLLKKEMPVNAEGWSPEDWMNFQEKHCDSSLSKVSVQELQHYHQALTSIVIMDPAVDSRAATILQQYNGRLTDIGSTVTQELSQQSPDTYTAFVADFNDNLAYSMKTSRGFPATPRPQSALSEEEWTRELQQLQDHIRTTLNSTTELEIQGSFLKTEYKTIPQPAHVDIPWKTLQQDGTNLWLAFFGLTQEGMILQIWPHAQHSGCHGQLVFIPLGKLLLMPSHIIHGGGFRTQPIFHPQHHGNVRYHLYLATNGYSLPRFANNVYTLPNDRSVEWSQVCINAPYLDGPGEDGALLVDLLFD
jgi:hypothetical protein